VNVRSSRGLRDRALMLIEKNIYPSEAFRGGGGERKTGPGRTREDSGSIRDAKLEASVVVSIPKRFVPIRTLHERSCISTLRKELHELPSTRRCRGICWGILCRGSSNENNRRPDVAHGERSVILPEGSRDFRARRVLLVWILSSQRNDDKMRGRLLNIYAGALTTCDR